MREPISSVGTFMTRIVKQNAVRAPPRGTARGNLVRPAPVDYVALSGGELTFVRSKIERQCRYLIGPPQSPHGLAIDERAQVRVVVSACFEALVQRWGIDCPRADGIAANTAGDEIRRDRLGESDHCGLGGTVRAPIGDTLDGTRHR